MIIEISARRLLGWIPVTLRSETSAGEEDERMIVRIGKVRERAGSRVGCRDDQYLCLSRRGQKRSRKDPEEETIDC